jgi:MoxR-like ATPase
LYGRKAIVDALVALMLRGQMVLLYGPVGIGKTAFNRWPSPIKILKNR